jgi:hypothetical protein
MEIPNPNLISIRFLTEAEEEAGKVFRTYSNYLRALATLADDPELLAINLVASSKKFHAIQRRKNADVSQVSKSLRQAWVEEASLDASRGHPSLALASYEAPRHAYFATYHAMRALYLAAADPVAHQHSAHLRAAANWVAERSALFTLPWILLLDGDPDRDDLSFCGKGSAIPIRDINPLATFDPARSTDLVAKFLKTTRRKQIQFVVAREKERRSLNRSPRGLRKKIATQLEPTSVFEALYRLRKRNDYEDGESFVLGAWSEDEAREFCANLSNVVHAALRQAELLVAAYLGLDAFDEPLERVALYAGDGNRPAKRLSEIRLILKR